MDYEKFKQNIKSNFLITLGFFLCVKKFVGMIARCPGGVVIASAYRTEDPGFEYRQGVRFLRNVYVAALLS
jgi:hypothetical protein